MSYQFSDVIDYNEAFMTSEEANALFKELMCFSKLTNMAELMIANGGRFECNFGKMMFIDRELLEKDAFPESVWGNNMEWTERMLRLKKRVEQNTNTEFQTCVCIFYPDGNSGIDFHSDEVAFGDTSIIPSISLGEERHFCLREKKTMEMNTLVLKHGSLVTMKDGCQMHFEHSLPEDSKYLKPRINLTFRKYGI